MCPRSNELHLAGEDCRETSKGMFLVTTNNEAPYASGQWTIQPATKYPSNSRRDPFLEQIDEYGKLDSSFNFASSYHTVEFHTVPSPANFYPYELHTNQISQTVHETTVNDGDKSRIDLDDDLKLGSTTERWRQNDKFILVENPLASLNRTMSEVISHHQQSSSNDAFQFPKVTYR